MRRVLSTLVAVLLTAVLVAGVTGGKPVQADHAQVAAEPESVPEELVSRLAYPPVDLPPPDAPDVLALAEDIGEDVEEARRRLQRQEATALLAGFAADSFPETYAGAWIDHDDGGLLKLAFTSNADAALAYLIQDYPFPEHVSALTVAHSLATLQVLRDQAVALEPQLKALVAEYQGLHLHAERNSVVVVLSELTEAAMTAVRSLLGEDAEFEQDVWESTPAAGTCESRYRCTPHGPLRGGLNGLANDGNLNNFCTLSYGATNTRGDRYMISAGHCTHVGDTWEHNGIALGGVPQAIDPYDGSPDNFDGARIFMPASYGWATSYYVWESDQSQLMHVQGVRQVTRVLVGHYVCKSGRTTFRTCGDVLAVRTSNGAGLTDGFRVDACGARGDSGSPVYSRFNTDGTANFIAYGILSSIRNACPGGSSFNAYAAYVFPRLDVSIRTNPP